MPLPAGGCGAQTRNGEASGLPGAPCGERPAEDFDDAPTRVPSDWRSEASTADPGSPTPRLVRPHKRVSFCDDVEVFEVSPGSAAEEEAPPRPTSDCRCVVAALLMVVVLICTDAEVQASYHTAVQSVYVTLPKARSCCMMFLVPLGFVLQLVACTAAFSYLSGPASPKLATERGDPTEQ